MAEFVVDENMPRSTAPLLRDAGYPAVDVRDVGLGGAKDDVIFAYAQSISSTLLTADRDFSSAVRFVPGTHAGIILVRIPNQVPNALVNREIIRSLDELRDQQLSGLLVVVEVGRTRVRRSAP